MKPSLDMSKLTASCKTGMFFILNYSPQLCHACRQISSSSLSILKSANLLCKLKHIRFVHESHFLKRESVVTTNLVFFFSFLNNIGDSFEIIDNLTDYLIQTENLMDERAALFRQLG